MLVIIIELFLVDYKRNRAKISQLIIALSGKSYTSPLSKLFALTNIRDIISQKCFKK